MKKKLITTLIIALLSLNVLPINAAAEAVIPAAIVEEPATPASEETVWYNRIYNGKLQRRLWSLTYQKWLTEWEDVE